MRHVIPEEAEIVNQNIALSSQFAASQRRSVADVMHHNVACSEVRICNVCGRAALSFVSHFRSLFAI